MALHCRPAPSTQATRLEVGYTGELLLMAPVCLADNITNLWIKHVWTSTQESRVTLLMDFAEIPLQCHGDVELMWLFNPGGRTWTTGAKSMSDVPQSLYALRDCNVEQESSLSHNSGTNTSHQNHLLIGLILVHHHPHIPGQYGTKHYPHHYTLDGITN